MPTEYLEQKLVQSAWAYRTTSHALDAILEVPSEAFQGHAQRHLWDAMRHVAFRGKELSEVEVMQYLQGKGLLGPEGMYWQTFKGYLQTSEPQPILPLRDAVWNAHIKRGAAKLIEEAMAKLEDPSIVPSELVFSVSESLHNLAINSGTDDQGDPFGDAMADIAHHGKLVTGAAEQGAHFPSQLFENSYPIPKGGVTIISARTNVGKCHGINTPILMHDGTVKMVQDIVVGDLVMGPDSNPRTVLSLASGQEQMYRVTTRNGDTFTCNESHILNLRMARGTNGAKRGDTVNISVRDYLSSRDSFKDNAKSWFSDAIEFGSEKSELPIPAYVFGVWLGDGTSRGASVTKGDWDVVRHFCEYAESLGMYIRVSDKDRCPTYHASKTEWLTNSISDKLRNLGVFGNKHIPRAYLVASIEDRMDLLAGLLDTDGHFATGGYEFVCKNKQFADDFEFLCRSLGFYCKMRKTTKTCTNTGAVGEYYRGFVAGDLLRIPLRCVRKRPPANYRRVKNALNQRFDIEPIGIGEYYGFTVDGDSLYVLGNFCVTHNSLWGFTSVKSTIEHGKHVIWVNLDMPKEQIKAKLASCISGVKQDDIQKHGIQSEEDRSKVINAYGLLREYCTLLHFPAHTTWDKIRPQLIKAIRKTGASAVFIDHFTQIGRDKAHGQRDDTQFAYISTSIKNLAQSYGVAVCLLVQINRSGATGEPGLNELVATGSLEQDATGVITLWPEEMADTQEVTRRNDNLFGTSKADVTTGDKWKNVDTIKMRLAKSQIGVAGTVVNLIRKGPINRFEELERATRW